MAVWRVQNNLGGKLLEQVQAARQCNSTESAGKDERSLPNVYEACSVILNNLDKTIAVFGDYDCDGICASIIMKNILERLGAEVIVRLPSRHEGYGIKPHHVMELREKGAGLIITVDNGISAADAARVARDLGVKMVVTDHHEPGRNIPNCIVVDPKLYNIGFRDYSGAGVAWLLGQELLKAAGLPPADNLLPYVSLATVVDIAPIKGPNWKLARKGLLEMRKQPPVGIKALISAAGIKKLGGYSFGWQIGPRINAAGRLGDPTAAYRLLETNDPAEAVKLAEQLDKINRERQEIVNIAAEECLKMYDGSYFPVFAINYPHGVVGVVAGKVSNTIMRPVIVGSAEGNIIKASGRSVGSFNIFEALEVCRKKTGLPEKFGGHAGACGLEIEVKELPILRAALNEIARSRLKPEDMVEWIDIDGEIKTTPDPEEVEELDKLEPFGEENPEPVFLLSGQIESVRSGEDWQLGQIKGIKFFATIERPLKSGQLIYAAVTPYIDEYNCVKSVMAKVQDVKNAVYFREKLLEAYYQWREGKEIDAYAEKIFKELGLSRTGPIKKKNLLSSKTFLSCGAI